MVRVIREASNFSGCAKVIEKDQFNGCSMRTMEIMIHSSSTADSNVAKPRIATSQSDFQASRVLKATVTWQYPADYKLVSSPAALKNDYCSEKSSFLLIRTASRSK